MVSTSIAEKLKTNSIGATVNIPQILNGHGFHSRDCLGTIRMYKWDLYVHCNGPLNKANIDMTVARMYTPHCPKFHMVLQNLSGAKFHICCKPARPNSASALTSCS